MRRRRDPRPSAIVPRGGPDARTFAQFRRESAALLTHGHGFSRTHAVHAVSKWDAHLKKLWRAGKPPCVAADQLARVEREGIKRGHDPRRRRRRTSRDADKPEKGEVYVSRYGNRWKVVEVNGDKVRVERLARAEEGSYTWSKRSLSGMRLMKAKDSGQLSFGFDRDPRRSGKQKTMKRRCRRSVVVQSVIFMKRDGWTKASAASWARSHGFRASKVDVTPTQLRVRQVAPSRVRVVGSKVVKHRRKAIRLVLGCPRRS